LFIRNTIPGEAGNWKEKLSLDLVAKIDKWTKEKFEGSSMKFNYGA